jgi:hypothetical protein
MLDLKSRSLMITLLRVFKIYQMEELYILKLDNYFNLDISVILAGPLILLAGDIK